MSFSSLPAMPFRFFLLGTLFSAQAFCQGPWQIGVRLQAGLEQDSNVFESVGSAEAATAGRFLIRGALAKRGEKLGFDVSGSSGLQYYPEVPDEHKLTTDMQSSLSWRISSRLRVTGRLRAFFKIFLNSPFDFGTTVSSLQAELFLPWHSVLGLSAQSARLDYASFDFYDYTASDFSITWRRPIARNASLSAGVQFGGTHYLREKFTTANDSFVVVSRLRQVDRQTSASLSVNFRQPLFVQFSLEWQRNSSNSFGYGYERWRLSAVAGWRLTNKHLLRFAMLTQRKAYSETLEPILPITLDAESNESNFLVTDYSYDIRPATQLLVRVAVYNNEAAVRGFSYQKVLLFMGFEFRF